MSNFSALKERATKVQPFEELPNLFWFFSSEIVNNFVSILAY